MNRCSKCGKFRKWEDLELWASIWISAQTGVQREESGYECKPDTGCKSWQGEVIIAFT